MSMNYMSHAHMTIEMRKSPSQIESMKRMLATKIVNKIPMCDLETLFQFTIIDPFTETNESIANGSTHSDPIFKLKIQQLRRIGIIELKAEIKID